MALTALAAGRQHFADLTFSASGSYGSGRQLRSYMSSGVIGQGWNPRDSEASWGFVYFDLPHLRSVPDRAELQVYAHQWFHNEGGTAVLTLVDVDERPLTGRLLVPGVPKPGPRTIELPDEWLQLLTCDGGGTGVMFGAPDEDFGRDLEFSGRLLASMTHLRVWWTR